MSNPTPVNGVISAVNDAAWHPPVPTGHSDYTWGRLGQAEGARVGGFLGVDANANSSAASKSNTSNKQEKKAKVVKSPTTKSAAASSSSPIVVPTPGPPILLGQESTFGDKPIVPIEGRRNILITSALPYVNNVPHLGNIIGCVLSADVYARFCRLRGHNTIYVCGTDEYGTATERKAMEEGLTPKQICDKYHVIHKQIYDWFNIKFDKFGRTTTPQQTEIAQEIYLALDKNGWSSEKPTKELYCEAHKKFLADRFVVGTCPNCQHDDANGDQCDKCGGTFDAIDLIKPNCKLCKEALALDATYPIQPPKIVSSNHIFLDLDRLQPQLVKWIDEAKVKGEWSENAISITQGQINKGLKSRPITKDLKWGTPVPKAGFEDKVFYVWFDAPIGYISITANYTDEWKKWWRNPKNVELVQFMGKDNIPFHTVMFPASLIAANPDWTLLHHVSCTEYLNYEGTKFSKSRNTGVFGDDAISTGIPSEVWRYYLLLNRPEQADTVFLWEDFAAKTNTELLNNLGNFINRTLSFIYSKGGNVVPPCGELTPGDQACLKDVTVLKGDYIRQLEKVKIKEGLKTVMAISGRANQYMQDNKPWELFASNRARCDTILNVSVNLISTLSVLLEPYMPSLSEKINAQLNQRLLSHGALEDKSGQPLASDFTFQIPAGHILGVPSVLFKKIDDDEIAALRLRFGGKPVAIKQGEPFPIQLVIGTIVEAKDHPGAPHNYVIQLQTDEPADVAAKQKLIKPGFRQVVAGLRPTYEPKDLIGKKVAVLANIKPSNFKEVRSEGVLLKAVKGNTFGLLTVPAGVASSVKNGQLAIPSECAPQFKANFDVKGLSKLDLLTRGESGTVFFGNVPVQIDLGGGQLVELIGEGAGEGAKITP